MTETFALKKIKIIEIFDKYPAIGQEIKGQCILRYKARIKNKVLEKREKEVEESNLKSVYTKTIYEEKKNQYLQDTNEEVDKEAEKK